MQYLSSPAVFVDAFWLPYLWSMVYELIYHCLLTNQNARIAIYHCWFLINLFINYVYLLNYPSLAARETYVAETNFASQKQENVFGSGQNIFASRTQFFLSKQNIMLASLATMDLNSLCVSVILCFRNVVSSFSHLGNKTFSLFLASSKTLNFLLKFALSTCSSNLHMLYHLPRADAAFRVQIYLD